MCTTIAHIKSYSTRNLRPKTTRMTPLCAGVACAASERSHAAQHREQLAGGHDACAHTGRRGGPRARRGRRAGAALVPREEQPPYVPNPPEKTCRM